jgi:hypothetical protein
LRLAVARLPKIFSFKIAFMIGKRIADQGRPVLSVEQRPTSKTTEEPIYGCDLGFVESFEHLVSESRDIPVKQKKNAPTTVGELLHWSYANLAMAHAAVSSKAPSYGTLHFMIRARLYKGLNEGRMNIGPFADEERLKMVLPQACCYCGSASNLSVDHLIPTKRGGQDSSDNMVWSCRSCNSSKGAQDVLEWFNGKGQFPPLLLLRRYLKLAIEICRSTGQMATPLEVAGEYPFTLNAIPSSYPEPESLRLWIVEI